MSARARLTQRALVERLTSPGVSDYNVARKPSWAPHLNAMPCWLYMTAERETVSATATVVTTDLKLMAPLSADVTEQDRINTVVDRRGSVIESGILAIEAVLRKRTHLELSLSRVTS